MPEHILDDGLGDDMRYGLGAMIEVERLNQALAEHYRTGDYTTLGMAMQDNWPPVREALERLREERDALGLLASQRRDEVRDAEYARERMAYERNEARDTANFHAEKRQAAEAEARRLTEGLRETEDVLSSVGNWLAGSPEPTAAVIEAIDLRIGKNRALLAASPTDEPIDGETYARRGGAK